ncbi:hypothetical protein Dimus_003852 [Dionaea muscipula]
MAMMKCSSSPLPYRYCMIPHHQYCYPNQNLSFGALAMKLRPPKKPLALQIKSSLRDQVFYEDRSKGIVCYRDDSGEIVCEGLDEGPHFHHPRVPLASYTRARARDQAHMINILQQRLLQIVNGGNNN